MMGIEGFNDGTGQREENPVWLLVLMRMLDRKSAGIAQWISSECAPQAPLQFHGQLPEGPNPATVYSALGPAKPSEWCCSWSGQNGLTGEGEGRNAHCRHLRAL